MEFLFVELPIFTRLRPRYLNDDRYRDLQKLLLGNPELGRVIQHTGGLRKFRFEDPDRRKGKRGGLRIIYFWWKDKKQIWLFTIYRKGEIADLTPAEKAVFRTMLRKEIKARLD